MAVTDPVVIMKFGGTSVADPGAIHRLTAIVAAARTRDAWRPVVVVSAMAGVTDALLALASAAVAGSASQMARAMGREVSMGRARAGVRAQSRSSGRSR